MTDPIHDDEPTNAELEEERDARAQRAAAAMEEVTRSLTGFDELAIEHWFERPLTRLSATMQGRALLFVLLRRDGEKDGKAHRAAMTMPLGDLDERFDGTVEMPGKAQTSAPS